ncbi:MAG: replication protein RepA [Candidatus Diapherotrites archaeon]|nr:replication protein RepA [Candidatus Diapherotrites archaeon]
MAVKRRPAKDLRISEISGEGERVSVVCTVVDFDPSDMGGHVDDGTGVARVALDDVLFAQKMTAGSVVRIIGRAYTTEDIPLIRAEVVQAFDADLDTYRSIVSLERRVYDEGAV